ncbi:MAG: serine/threonine protein kinase [Polyangiaceae bacterium]|nr:serine/threonine protein kinase [Polyangiaceae bacterium]
MSSALPKEGDVLAGKLRVVRLLGAGGMGAVYEVEHEYTKHRRALKLLHGDMARIPAIVARFLREASAAGRIGNPHIVESFDAGRLDSGEPYLVMELLRGRSLTELLRERGRLALPEAARLLQQACEGLEAAHAAGIVHRDLKPDNLFLTGATEEPFVKILDFGISKFDPALTGDHALTQEGSTLGTPFYMPPEQVRGDATVAPQADVYALGVVLYECITGRRPFVAESLPHLSVLIHEGRYTPATELVPELPSGVDAVIARAMAPRREDRFPTATALGEALRALERGAEGWSSRDLLGATVAQGTPGTAPATAAPVVVRAAPAAPSLGGAGGGELAATTHAAASVAVPTAAAGVEPAAPRRVVPLAIGAAVIALSAALVALASRGSGTDGGSIAPSGSAAASAAAASSAVLVEVGAVASPEVAVAPVGSAAASAGAGVTGAASVSGAIPAASSKGAGPRVNASATPGRAPGATRAGQHGLAEDNPL